MGCPLPATLGARSWREARGWDGRKVYGRDRSAKPPRVSGLFVLSVPMCIAVHIEPRMPPFANRMGR